MKQAVKPVTLLLSIMAAFFVACGGDEILERPITEVYIYAGRAKTESGINIPKDALLKILAYDCRRVEAKVECDANPFAETAKQADNEAAFKFEFETHTKRSLVRLVAFSDIQKDGNLGVGEYVGVLDRQGTGKDIEVLINAQMKEPVPTE